MPPPYEADPDAGGIDRPIRVLAVTNMWPESDPRQGAFVRRLVDNLRNLGVLVDVEVIAQSRGHADYLLSAWRVRRLVNTGRYDLIHAHFGMSALATRFAGRIPRVLSLYGSDINVGWKRWLTKAGWGGTTARIYVSYRLADRAGDSGGHVVPNGVDLDEFCPGDRQHRRRELGLQRDQHVVLFGADPTRAQKGYSLYSDVLVELKRRGIAASPLILSEPSQPAARVVAKIDAADALLFTSARGTEGSPTVVKEAIVMGLPVVSVDVGDVAERLRNVEPSAVVRYDRLDGSVEDRGTVVNRLTDALSRILQARARSNGVALRAELSLRAEAQHVLQIYRNVLSQ